MNTNPTTYDNIRNRLIKEPLYLYDGFEEAALRTNPTGNGLITFVKFKGKPEFKALEGSNLVANALLTPVLISKEDYDKY